MTQDPIASPDESAAAGAGGPLIISHRANMKVAPENTIAGIQSALDVCVDEALRSWILGFGAQARVIAPETLVSDIAAELKRARAGYER